MKLLIQIPCLNEEGTLPLTWEHLPRRLPGVDVIETLVIDDGSNDRTAEVARRLGATHVLRLVGRRGLASAFKEGLSASLRLGADVVVNTDADNQYRGEDIAALIEPILRGEADIVIGDRRPGTQRNYSFMKRRLQRLGSWVVRRLTGADVRDAASGFRAYSRDAALRTNVLSSYTYTHDTLLQAGSKNLKILSVPIQVNPPVRASRLIGSTIGYVARSAATILRAYVAYAPMRALALTSALILAPGVFLVGRFFYHYVASTGQSGYTQSLVIGVGLAVIAAIVLLFGVLADLTRVNRMLLEDVLYELRRQGDRKDRP